MSEKRFKIRIYGRVQGVWYRASAQQQAEKLGLSGWVRNEDDGSVGAEVQGAEGSLEAFIEWCWRGPQQAEVKQVEIEEQPVQVGSQGFLVRP